MQESFWTILQNFGAFGLALIILGSGFWWVWKKIIEPQRKDSQEHQEKHIETLNKIIENHNRETSKHIEAEKENIKVLQELNGSLKSHNQKTSSEHQRILDEVKRNKK
ncbi:unnamed protein product [marine sediment metagenome]|uniref:Uncharacterized protein n=1 Tax=marine sediment metagenome TaxID=412755 RepID=X1H3K7_9ZZZZ